MCICACIYIYVCAGVSVDTHAHTHTHTHTQFINPRDILLEALEEKDLSCPGSGTAFK